MDDGAKPRILLVSHCLLNSYSSVKGRRAPKEMARRLVMAMLEEGVGVFQLPCPEFTYEGPNRWAKSYEQYDTTFFRTHCRDLVEPVRHQVREYVKDGARILGVIGVGGSPSCGAFHVYEGADWGGCFDKGPDGSPWQVPGGGKVHGRGVFLEAVAQALLEEGVDVPVLELPKDDADAATVAHFEKVLARLLSEAGVPPPRTLDDYQHLC